MRHPFANPWLVWLAWVLGAAVFVLTIIQAGATWKPEYAQSDPAMQDWYRNAELTEAARMRFGFKSCCAHSDVVKTRFRPAKDGADGWDYLDGNVWKQVPSDIIHTDQSAPGGEPVMFAVGGQPTCFFPPQGGI